MEACNAFVGGVFRFARLGPGKLPIHYRAARYRGLAKHALTDVCNKM